MLHGLTNQFLYSAYKIVATFVDGVGNVRSGTGSCFFVKNRLGKLCLVTNRHVLDYSYKKADPAAANFQLRQIDISGKTGSGPQNVPTGDVSFSVAPMVRFPHEEANDIACITELVMIRSGRIPIDYFIPYEFVATTSDFENDLQVCDFVAFPGFPEWHDSEAKRPIMRTGTISSDPRYDYAYMGEVGGASTTTIRSTSRPLWEAQYPGFECWDTDKRSTSSSARGSVRPPRKLLSSRTCPS